MMRIEELPRGTYPEPIAYPHFPTRWQLFLWRNWGLVPAERLSGILGCSLDEISAAVAELGLPATPTVNAKWSSHGYLTLIRSNWQLLPYSQMLQLLDWTPEKMAYTLKEEDFFWVKVGRLKPNCPELHYAPLTVEQEQATALLRQDLQAFLPAGSLEYEEQPFAFSENFHALPQVPGKDRFEFNYIHSYAASCGDVLGNADTLNPVPENLLAQYASMGIRGVWMHALLYLLCPIPGAEEYSAGAEKRMANLRRIVNTCAKYGIKVYLYLNEPRCMPMPFYDKKPEWAGIEVPSLQTRTICTTRSPEPLQWLEDAMKRLFTEARGLGGVFCITMSENPTNCHYGTRHQDCPSCKDVAPDKIIADVVTAMERGMHAADPDARMIAYDWAWRENANDTDNAPFKRKVMERLPKSVYIDSVSEWGKPIHIGDTRTQVVDYSISQVGPSEESLTTWRNAQSLGLKVAAKIQMNNSWELSAVPYVPVPYLVQEHLENLKKAGVSGLMLSWTLGGYPAGNLELLRATPEEIAAARFPKELAAVVCQAWKLFSEAYRNFPFNVSVLYNAPQNYGPMNLLHGKPSGFKSTMVGFPYDDLNAWRGPYPEDIFEHQFDILCKGWKEGLELLQKQAVPESCRHDFEEILRMAEVSYLHLYSTRLQIHFVRARNAGQVAEMRLAVEGELENARKLLAIVRGDSRIGFEASNHYFYTINDLAEKVLNCAWLLRNLL